MKLNRTGNPLDRETRNKDNENWAIIESGFKDVGNDINRIDGRVDNFVEEVSNEALGKVIDNAKLNWKEPVNSFSDLPSIAEEGDTRMVRYIDENKNVSGKVYRYDGENWIEIQQIDAGPVNELDSRLTTQLSETNQQINRFSVESRPRHRRRILKDLPIHFPDYNEITDIEGFKNTFYPREMQVLEERDLLVIQYANTGARTTWAVLYKWTTFEYLSCFKLEAYNTHGFTIQERGTDLIYLIPDSSGVGSSGDLHEYNITNLPSNMASITPSHVYDLGNRSVYIASNKDKVITSIRHENVLSIHENPGVHGIKDENIVKLSESLSLMLNTAAQNDRRVPKIQGIGLGGDFIVFGVGRGSPNKETSHVHQQGIIVTDLDGKILFTSLYRAKEWHEFLASEGYDVRQVECEGLSVSDNGNVYSLVTYYNTTPDTGLNEMSNRGMLIVEELSNHKDAHDLSNISDNFKLRKLDNIDYVYPTSRGKENERQLRNLFNNELFTSLEEIIDFVRSYEIPHMVFNIYSDSKIKGVNDELLDGSHILDVRNFNNFTVNATLSKGSNVRNIYSVPGGELEYRDYREKTSVLQGTHPIKLNEVIELESVDGFNELIIETKNPNNEIRTMPIGSATTIASFNMSDSVSAEGIVLYEYTIEHNVANNTLVVTHAIQQSLSGNMDKGNIQSGVTLISVHAR